MKLFARYQRFGSTVFSAHQGMTPEVIEKLLTDLGCENIEFMPESDWIAAQEAP